MSHCLACRLANQILGALTAPARLYSQVDAPEWKQAPWACRTDQAGVAVFVQDYLPIAALESIECEIYLVHGQIGDAARSEHDDLLSLISASAGSQNTAIFENRATVSRPPGVHRRGVHEHLLGHELIDLGRGERRIGGFSGG